MYKNTVARKHVPKEVKWQMKQLLTEWKRKQIRKTTINCEIGSPQGNYLIDEEEEEVGPETPRSSNPGF